MTPIRRIRPRGGHLRFPGGLRSALLAVAALAAPGLAGCRDASAPAAPPPPTVGVVESRRMTVPILATPNGTTRALQEVAVRARVRGFLTGIHFEEGSTVKKGQLLFVIDEEPYKVALQSALARREEAEAALRKAEQSKAREVAEAKLALDRAQLALTVIEERRARTLLSRSAGSAEDVDRAQADRKRYEAEVQADVASLEQAKADYDVGILAARAQVAAAQAAVRDAEINLGYCRMEAAIDGRIGEAKVKLGNLVGPDSAGGSYTELATIQQLDPMGIDIRASSRNLERAARLIGEGLKVRLTLPGLDGDREYPYEGECFFIDNTIDPTTSTFLVKARIPNPEGMLLPGEYVKLRAIVDRLEDAVVVPESAVMETEAGPVVYVVDGEGKVAVRRVTAAQSHEGIRVISKGLDAGVPVIVQGLQLVRPGIPVKTEPAVLPQLDVPAEPAAQEAPAGGDAAPKARPEAPPAGAAEGPAPASKADPGR